MHADNIPGSDRLRLWRKHPASKGISVPGDDRTPGWTWQTYLHTDLKGVIAVPREMLHAALRKGSANLPKKGRSTFKTDVAPFLDVTEPFLPVQVIDRNGEPEQWRRTINISELLPESETSFDAHLQRVHELGFDINVIRVPVQTSKHIRTRPMFGSLEPEKRTWGLDFNVQVTNTALADVLPDICALAGLQAGIGDWRPSSPKSQGRFGKFSCRVFRVKGEKFPTSVEERDALCQELHPTVL